MSHLSCLPPEDMTGVDDAEEEEDGMVRTASCHQSSSVMRSEGILHCSNHGLSAIR